MAPNAKYIQSTFHALCEVANEYPEERVQYKDAEIAYFPEDEKDSVSTIFDLFLNSIVLDGILKMTNFTPKTLKY